MSHSHHIVRLNPRSASQQRWLMGVVAGAIVVAVIAWMWMLNRAIASTPRPSTDEFEKVWEQVRAAGSQTKDVFAESNPIVDAMVPAIEGAYQRQQAIEAVAAQMHLIVEPPAFPVAEDRVE